MRTSLEKVFAVLEVIAASETPVTLKSISEQTGHNPSTLSRVLSDLIQVGYVRKHGYREFTLDLGLIPLGQKALSRFHLAKVANPRIHEVAARLGFQGALVGLHRGRLVYLYRTQTTPDPASGASAAPFDYPLHRSIAGRVILASLPDPEARKLLEDSMRESGLSAAEVRSAIGDLMEAVREARAKGFASCVDAAGLNISFPVQVESRVFAVSLYGRDRSRRKRDVAALEGALLVRRIEQAI